MSLAEDVKPVTYMKARAAELLRSLEENRRPVVITQNGEAKGVMLDVASYQELKDSVLMLKLLALGEADVRAGRIVPQAEAFRKLEAGLEEAQEESNGPA